MTKTEEICLHIWEPNWHIVEMIKTTEISNIQEEKMTSKC